MGTSFLMIIAVFVIGYACIALEHPLKINKAASALLLGVCLWVIIVASGGSAILSDVFKDLMQAAQGNEELKKDLFKKFVSGELFHHLSEISQILFFLLGAMTIVELVDTYGGFKVVTNKINTASRVKFLWIISIIAFFLSAVLDNMTTTIVMVALLRKLVYNKHDRWFFAGMVVLAANAGGAWSPIGDVTTIMLWIGKQVTAANIIIKTFLASLTSIVVPLIVLSFTMKGKLEQPETVVEEKDSLIPKSISLLMFFLGVGLLLFVPVFKTLTDLPPYLGMVGSLAILWITTEMLHAKRPSVVTESFKVTSVIRKVDVPSVLFFLGILLAVGALQTAGHLGLLANKLETIPLEEPNKYFLISGIIGLLSAVVDNVPLVAGAIQMYKEFPTDHYFWEFIAYCAGTGGSILIIGSAAGVAAMGLEKIDFIWYLKKISWIALIGYLAGALVFIGQYFIFHS